MEWAPGEDGVGESTSAEIDAFCVRDVAGPRLRYTFARQRRLFRQGGVQGVRLHDSDGVEVEDFKPYRDPQYKENPDMGPGVFGTRHLLREQGCDCVPTTGERTTQSETFRLVNSMVQYHPITEEPREEEREAIDAAVLEMLERTIPDCHRALLTNATFKVFEDDFANLGDEETLGNTSDNAIREYTSPFTDINYSKNKTISAIDWMPDAKGMVAVACVDSAGLDEQVETDGKVHASHILIWNFKDPIHPQIVLEAPSDVTCFRFNAKNSDLLAAGCASGQVIYYHLGAAKRAAKGKDANDEEDNGTAAAKETQHEMASTIEGSHRRAVSSLQWLPAEKEVHARTGALVAPTTTDGASQQIVSLAPDGMLLFWDLRITKEDKNGAVLWTPIYRIHMSSLEFSGDLSGTMLCLDPAVEGEDATKFHIGTESGELVEGTWVLPEEKDETTTYLTKSNTSHFGAIVSVQRSPFFEDTIMTVGDWTFNLHRAGAAEPSVRSSFAPTQLTTGRFSPTRPGVSFMGRADGSIDVWDLLDRSHEPSLVHNVGPAAISAIEFWGDAAGSLQLLAVGDQHGTLHVLEVPRALRRASPHEAQVVQTLLDRELARVHYMEARLALRAKELSVREAEDEELRAAEAEAAAKAAAAAAAAREAAEAEAAALADDKADAAPEEEEDVGAPRLDKADEAIEVGQPPPSATRLRHPPKRSLKSNLLRDLSSPMEEESFSLATCRPAIPSREGRSILGPAPRLPLRLSRCGPTQAAYRTLEADFREKVGLPPREAEGHTEEGK